MYGLSSALSTALSGLLFTSAQSDVISQNISRANDPNYSRETASAVISSDGSIERTQIQRAARKQLTDAVLQSTSDASAQSALLNGYNTLSTTVGDVQSSGSVAWGIDQLKQSLKAAEASPGNATTVGQAVASASSLANILNNASATVAQVRTGADQQMATSVANINSLLNQFQQAQDTVLNPNSTQQQVVAAQDSRDGILKQLSQEIGISTTTQPNGGLAIYTDSGVTLFNVTARNVSFNPTVALQDGAIGNAVYVDGVPVSGANSPMPIKSGNLAALANLRDNVATTYQSQLDAMASNLVATFAETDQSASPSKPAATGLFTYGGSPTVPTASTPLVGLADSIKVNVAFDPTQGGNAFLLRDGGANGAAYVYNASGATGYQSRLTSLINAMGQTQSFSASTGLPASSTLAGYAAASASWVEAGRGAANTASTTATATQKLAMQALSNGTGVNIDQEMSNLLSVEQSYQASAKVLTTVNQMLGDLMNAIR